MQRRPTYVYVRTSYLRYMHGRASFFLRGSPTIKYSTLCKTNKMFVPFIWLISHDWKYCWLIFFKRRILFIGWKIRLISPANRAVVFAMLAGISRWSIDPIITQIKSRRRRPLCVHVFNLYYIYIHPSPSFWRSIQMSTFSNSDGRAAARFNTKSKFLLLSEEWNF